MPYMCISFIVVLLFYRRKRHKARRKCSILCVENFLGAKQRKPPWGGFSSEKAFARLAFLPERGVL